MGKNVLQTLRKTEVHTFEITKRKEQHFMIFFGPNLTVKLNLFELSLEAIFSPQKLKISDLVILKIKLVLLGEFFKYFLET